MYVLTSYLPQFFFVDLMAPRFCFSEVDSGGVGLKLGEKQEASTSYSAIQSCAIENTGSTIWQVQ